MFKRSKTNNSNEKRGAHTRKVHIHMCYIMMETYSFRAVWSRTQKHAHGLDDLFENICLFNCAFRFWYSRPAKGFFAAAAASCCNSFYTLFFLAIAFCLLRFSILAFHSCRCCFVDENIRLLLSDPIQANTHIVGRVLYFSFNTSHLLWF